MVRFGLDWRGGTERKKNVFGFIRFDPPLSGFIQLDRSRSGKGDASPKIKVVEGDRFETETIENFSQEAKATTERDGYACIITMYSWTNRVRCWTNAKKVKKDFDQGFDFPSLPQMDTPGR